MTSILGRIQNQLEYRKVTSRYTRRRSSVKLHNDEYNNSATSLDDDYGYHDRKSSPKASKNSSPKRSPLKPPSTSYFLDYEPGFDQAREGNGRSTVKRTETGNTANTYASSNYDDYNSSAYSVSDRPSAYDPPKKNRSQSVPQQNPTGAFSFTPSTRNRSGTATSRTSNNPWADSLPSQQDDDKPVTTHNEHMTQQELFNPDYLDFLATKKAPPPPPVSHNTGHRHEVDLLADDTDHLTNYHSREEERGRYNTEGVTDRYDAFDQSEGDGYGHFSRVKSRQSQGNLKKLGRRLSLFK